VLGFARSMTYAGEHPQVFRVGRPYASGVCRQGLRIVFALEVLIPYSLPSCARLRVVVGMLRVLA
jgi:hypothetical protein